jgi:hypothetical protein
MRVNQENFPLNKAAIAYVSADHLMLTGYSWCNAQLPGSVAYL